MKLSQSIRVLLGMGVLSVFFLCSTGQAAGLKFGFKITGGINYTVLGDGDAYLRGTKAHTDDFIADTGYTLERRILPFVNHVGTEFDADAVLFLTPQLGISLGTGFLRAGTLFGSGNQIITSSTTKETDSNTVAATAMPLKLGITYTFSSVFVPSGKSSSYVYFGIGFYSAKYASTEKWTYQTSWSDYSETAKASGLGFNAGWGTENWINPNFAFVFELYGRYAKIGGFQGDWKFDSDGAPSSGSGTLYYYEWLGSASGKWYPSTTLAAKAPSGTSIRNAREAKIDFSGLGLRFGIKVSL